MRREMAGICLSFVISGAWAGRTITPVEMTYTSIGETQYRIHLYAKVHRKLPPNLDALPKREGYMNSVEDAWGTRLSYRVHDDGTFTLSSLGKDRKAGGTGDNADIVTRYRWRDKSGRFLAADNLWTATAEIEGAEK
jgi:hypothetical protein